MRVSFVKVIKMVEGNYKILTLSTFTRDNGKMVCPMAREKKSLAIICMKGHSSMGKRMAKAGYLMEMVATMKANSVIA